MGCVAGDRDCLVIVVVLEFRRDRSPKLIGRSRLSCEQVRCGMAMVHWIVKDDFCLLIILGCCFDLS